MEILRLIMPRGKFLGLDWDLGMLNQARKKIIETTDLRSLISKQIFLVQDNYIEIPKILEKRGLGKADGLIIDLGMSSVHLESSKRGFSFLRDEPLDMRFDPKEGRLTAADIVNTKSYWELKKIFKDFGEERFAEPIARKIIEERNKKIISSSKELADMIASIVPRPRKKFAVKIHPATKTFQALRIFVNDELQNLEKVLGVLDKIVCPNGRVVIISFHSLEDRLVKRKFREMAKEGAAKLTNKKPLTPTEEEVKINPRSRSAKLRGLIINK